MATSRISLVAARRGLTIAPGFTGPRALYDDHGSYKHWQLVPGTGPRAPSHAYPTSARHPDTLSLATRNSQRIHNYTGVLSGIAATQLTAFGVRAGLVGPQPVSSRVDSRLQQPRWLHPYAGRYPAAGAAKGSLRRPPCASLDQLSAFKWDAGFFWVSVWPLPSF